MCELQQRVEERGHSWDPRLRLALAHCLDQHPDKYGARFSWHKDTAENHVGRDIKWSMVVALRMGPDGKTPPMQIAGAQVSKYEVEGEYQVFPASLWHSTVPSDQGGLKVGLFFAVPW